MNIYEKLLEIQIELKAPKNQYNSFGNYNYRNAEDILEAVKPLCKKNKCILTLSDSIINIGDRYYIQAIARLSDLEKSESIEVNGLAREPLEKKGMDSSQITGATSSYARKYALNGLFNIDDTKDSDSNEITKKTIKTVTEQDVKKVNNTLDSIKEKQKIFTLAKEIGLKPDATQIEISSFIFSKTKLALEDKNYKEIISRLEIIKQENGSKTI